LLIKIKINKNINFEYVTKSQLLTQISHYRVFNKKKTKIYGISTNTFGKVWIADIHDNPTTIRILYDKDERLTSAKNEKFQISI
jgi:alkyl hydroperoxide reductase subunit AhpC